ncbi:MAG: hypothetical protein ACD_9C00096G0002 [uncultured bacterium]|nr:MAG: hypothetical protein ACD_9C00096G0002 [uncultured bacterium]KKQ44362.1 MAG: Sensory box protein/response regulator [Candidatus Moranbacteria bacterium GW2011_GWC2_37_8]KKQ61085.1 MAG: Sensory box protein/response regulator [Parcubacteria group bacterium GW2011_GWC1_38_22]
MENKKTIVLVVDDDLDLLELSAVSLAAKGFEVLQAKNGKEALEWLDRKASEIKLIILDIVMPEMDGFEFMEVVRKKEQYKNIPIIVTSNLDSDADRQAAFALGAKDFFEKVKMNPSQVADKVKKMLGC